MSPVKQKFLLDKYRFPSCDGITRPDPLIMQKSPPNRKGQDLLQQRGLYRHGGPLITISIYIPPKTRRKLPFAHYSIIRIRITFIVYEPHPTGNDLHIGSSAEDFKISLDLIFSPNIVVIA